MERLIHATLFVDADPALSDETILKGLEQTVPGTTIVKTVQGGKALSAVIDGIDAGEVVRCG